MSFRDVPVADGAARSAPRPRRGCSPSAFRTPCRVRSRACRPVGIMLAIVQPAGGRCLPKPTRRAGDRHQIIEGIGKKGQALPGTLIIRRRSDDWPVRDPRPFHCVRGAARIDEEQIEAHHDDRCAARSRRTRPRPLTHSTPACGAAPTRSPSTRSCSPLRFPTKRGTHLRSELHQRRFHVRSQRFSMLCRSAILACVTLAGVLGTPIGAAAQR
jgi:hypothetical protein